MKICFSTLGCTEKPLAEVLHLAYAAGMDGIELRGLSGMMDNAEIPEFRPENMDETARMFAESGVKPVVLGTSCMFHTPEKAEAALKEGACSIRIAQRLGIPYIRVFGNNVVGDREACIARVADGISQLCGMASQCGVTVLLEVHGDFNTAETLLPELYDVYEALEEEQYTQWHESYKPFGYEVLGEKFGGQLILTKNTAKKLRAYLSGETETIGEFEVELLDTERKLDVTFFGGNWISAYV